MTFQEIIVRLEEELAEVKAVASYPDSYAFKLGSLIEEATDVANFAMFLADAARRVVERKP